MVRYLKLWLVFAKIRLLTNIHESWSGLFFILGKFIRYLLIGLFLLTLGQQVDQIKGYSLDQMILIYLLFNFLDLTGQFLFRGIYIFRNQVIYGSFDRSLLQPLSSIFTSLFNYIDFLDLPLWVANFGLLIYYLLGYELVKIAWFSLMLVNGVWVVFCFHLFVASLIIIWEAGDQLIFLYRDISALNRLPLRVYGTVIRILLLSLIPIGIAYSVPADILFARANWLLAVWSFLVSLGFGLINLRLWRYALRQYASASS